MNKWYRVNKKRRCVICDHPDWCTWTEGGACCMRRESDRPMRNGGWFHKSGYARPYIPSRPAIPEKVIDFARIWNQQQPDAGQVDGLGINLGVDTDALLSIGCAWMKEYSAFAFPMRDARIRVIGIRLRNPEGAKWAIKGSRSGLFIPNEYAFSFEGAIWIVEGPTDLAAALTLGLYAIGRAACLGQEEMILEYVCGQKAKRVVIVTDNDDPGLRGAAKLQAMLSVPSCVYVPPVKDIREFLNAGGNRRMIEAAVKDMVWTTPARRAA